MIPRIQTQQSWAESRVAGLPYRWRRRLLATWEEGGGASEESAKWSGVNTALREITEQLQAVRLPLSATDAEICERAEELARDAIGLASAFHEPEALRAAMGRMVEACGVNPPSSNVETMPAIRRMACRDWWRRGLRKMHGIAVEGAAIRLGYVNRAREIYCSNETKERRVLSALTYIRTSKTASQPWPSSTRPRLGRGRGHGRHSSGQDESAGIRW